MITSHHSLPRQCSRQNRLEDLPGHFFLVSSLSLLNATSISTCFKLFKGINRYLIVKRFFTMSQEPTLILPIRGCLALSEKNPLIHGIQEKLRVFTIHSLGRGVKILKILGKPTIYLGTSSSQKGLQRQGLKCGTLKKYRVRQTYRMRDFRPVWAKLVSWLSICKGKDWNRLRKPWFKKVFWSS